MSKFGTPQQIAEACVDDMDTRELLHNLCIQRELVRLAYVMAAAIVAIWLSFVMLTCTRVMDDSPGYFEISVEVIDRTDVVVGE